MTEQERRILVVDDNADAADSLAMLFEARGDQVRTAYDGVEALEAEDAFRPDTILLDIGMPRLSGYDVARRVRELRGGDGDPHAFLLSTMFISESMSTGVVK